MWIDRLISERIRSAFNLHPVLAVVGARQTGKTSLMQSLFPNIPVVSLDNPSVAEQANTQPGRFLASHPFPLMIDEAQYSPALFRHLKERIDQDRNRPGQVILTGSQAFQLMDSLGDSLAGRVAIFDLDGLTLAEIPGAAHRDVLEYLIRGSFPELYAKPEINLAIYYDSYIATYLDRDIRKLTQVHSLRDFDRFLRVTALRSGQMLNKTDVSRDVGISPTTASQWLSLLETSKQISLLEPWFSNKTKGIAKTPKLFWNDTGLICSFLNIRSREDFLNHPQAGHIWESFVFNEIRKLSTLEHERKNLFCYRDKTLEVDVVLERAGRLILFEAKNIEMPNADQGHQLIKVSRKLDSQPAMYLVSPVASSYSLPNGVEVISAFDLRDVLKR
jgi:predicted AAA+ superfamily ATPase